MAPDDNEAKRAVPAVGMLTTYTYSGPVAWPRRRQNTETPTDGDDKADMRLELIDGKTRPVTYLFEEVPDRRKRSE